VKTTTKHPCSSLYSLFVAQLISLFHFVTDDSLNDMFVFLFLNAFKSETEREGRNVVHTVEGATGTRVVCGCRSGADWALRRLHLVFLYFTPPLPTAIPPTGAQVCVCGGALAPTFSSVCVFCAAV
jgi:hypothetical protein